MIPLKTARGRGQRRTDAALLAACRKEPAAFAEVYDRHAEAVFRWLKQRVREEETALDLTAETFAEALTHAHRFRDEVNGSARPWLFGIARNLLLAYHRANRVERAARDRLGIPVRDFADPVSVAAEVGGSRVSEQLRGGLASLPTDQRVALGLRVLEDLSYEEVGARLSISPGASRKRVMRALHFLRDHLNEGAQP